MTNCDHGVLENGMCSLPEICVCVCLNCQLMRGYWVFMQGGSVAPNATIRPDIATTFREYGVMQHKAALQ